MDRPRWRRRSAPTGLPRAAAVEGPRPPSRSSPFFKSVAFLAVSAACCCASLPSRAEAFVTSSGVRALDTHRHRAGKRPESSERGRISVAMLSSRGLWPGRPTIDLRSDTVTQPTGGMRKAMHKVRRKGGLFLGGGALRGRQDLRQRVASVEQCMCWQCVLRRLSSSLRYMWPCDGDFEGLHLSCPSRVCPKYVIGIACLRSHFL